MRRIKVSRSPRSNCDITTYTCYISLSAALQPPQKEGCKIGYDCVKMKTKPHLSDKKKKKTVHNSPVTVP